MMSDIKNIILIQFIKNGFSCLFSTFEAEVIQTKNTMEVASKSSRREPKVTWRLAFLCAFSQKKQKSNCLNQRGRRH